MAECSSYHKVNADNVNCNNVSGSYNNTINFNTRRVDEDPQILAWLSPLEPQQRHHGVRTNRVAGIGSWLLETNEFKKWSKQEPGGAQSVLFCYGNPGAGKTFLTSLVVDNLCDQQSEKGITVVGLYSDFQAHEEQSATNMLGAILKLLVKRTHIPGYIREAFRKAKKEFGGRRLLLPELLETLKRTIAQIPEIFICIDALDECSPKHQLDLLRSLGDILLDSPHTRVFLTGRPHVKDEIDKFFAEAVKMPVGPTTGDILQYLNMRLDGDTEADAMDDELRADIMKKIPEAISEVFLLVSLNIKAILGEVTIYRRRKKLDEMTKGKGVADAYTVTLARMKAQNESRSRLGMEVLMWVSYSERPLRTDELCHALGIERGSTDMNPQSVPSIKTLLRCCLGLVTVEGSSSTVRLVHFTLKEYLSENPALFHSPHAMIAEVCLTYLNFQSIRELSIYDNWSLLSAPLLRYATHYWIKHFRREVKENVKPLALRLLDVYDKHISCELFLREERSNSFQIFYSRRPELPRRFSGLHFCAYLGFSEIMVDLLAMKKWDLSAVDSAGNTAMTWAARKGHGAAMKILLQQGNIHPDAVDKDGRTLLWWGAMEGKVDVVKALLERTDINPNKADNHGRTPLKIAVMMGWVNVVKVLLERSDIDPNMPDNGGQTPLWCAVVNALLEGGDINPNIADINGQTSISVASLQGRFNVVKALLERRDCDPNLANKDGDTPLILAFRKGHVKVVKALLDRGDIDPNIADSEGRTLLSWASENGRFDAPKALLERSDIDPNIADNRGRTPLSWASLNWHFDVVKALLERRDCDPNLANKDGDTPLILASRKGHVKVVKALLDCGDIDPNIAGNKGRTPLSWASSNENFGVVKALLERSDIDPNIADNKGRTPLSWASSNWHFGVVKALLERSDIDPNIADNKGRTPLSWASENRRFDALKALLERSDIDPNTADNNDRTPLWWASSMGHIGVVAALLEGANV